MPGIIQETHRPSQCGQSVLWLGLVRQPFRSAPTVAHIYLPAHTLTLMHTESLGSNLSFFFFFGLLKKKKKSLDNHYIGIKV